mmetsp:Transcript_34803/g.64417  ORF Transcript_34803/g.64417 Transcript_34803/m.64417 type:complete len:414 (-) Transcript_34803:210-1451(-)
MQCTDRNPSRRPEFSQLITILSDMQMLDWVSHMGRFDIPRIREYLWSSSYKLQIIASKELESLFMDKKVTRNIEKKRSAASSRTTMVGVERKSADKYMMSNEEAIACIQSLSNLLSSPSKEVQLQALRSLRVLLEGSENRETREHDLGVIIDQALRLTIKLLGSERKSIREAASALVMALSEGERFHKSQFILKLKPAVRERICHVLQKDIESLRTEQERLNVSMATKEDLLKTFAAAAKKDQIWTPSDEDTGHPFRDPPPLPAAMKLRTVETPEPPPIPTKRAAKIALPKQLHVKKGTGGTMGTPEEEVMMFSHMSGNTFLDGDDERTEALTEVTQSLTVSPTLMLKNMQVKGSSMTPPSMALPPSPFAKPEINTAEKRGTKLQSNEKVGSTRARGGSKRMQSLIERFSISS